MPTDPVAEARREDLAQDSRLSRAEVGLLRVVALGPVMIVVVAVLGGWVLRYRATFVAENTTIAFGCLAWGMVFLWGPRGARPRCIAGFIVAGAIVGTLALTSTPASFVTSTSPDGQYVVTVANHRFGYFGTSDLALSVSRPGVFISEQLPRLCDSDSGSPTRGADQSNASIRWTSPTSFSVFTIHAGRDDFVIVGNDVSATDYGWTGCGWESNVLDG